MKGGFSRCVSVFPCVTQTAAKAGNFIAPNGTTEVVP
jgi:hypothetical protein